MSDHDADSSEASDDGSRNDLEDDSGDDVPSRVSVTHFQPSPGMEFARSLPGDDEDDEEEDELSSSIARSGMALLPTPSPGKGKKLDEDEQPVLPIPTSVWDLKDYVSKSDVPGDKHWKCLMCKSVFKGPPNSTKAKAHLARVVKADIKPCMARPLPPRNVLDMFERQWQALLDSKKEKVRRTIADAQSEAMSAAAGAEQLILHSRSRDAKKLRQLSSNNPPMSAKKSPKKSPTTTTIAGASLGSIESFLPGNVERSNVEMDWLISRFIFEGGWPFSIVEDPNFVAIIRKAKLVGQNYKPPYRKRVSEELLKLLYEEEYGKMTKQLREESDIFGLVLYGDGATIAKTPFINILAGGVHLPNACLEIHDCTAQLAAGGRKTAKYIADTMIFHMNKIDPKGRLVDLVIFDGASNVQKAGKILEERYPLITCIHGAEHVVSLFFLMWRRPRLEKCM